MKNSPAETRRLLKLAANYLKMWVDGYEWEHEDPQCPEDDTCLCGNAKNLNDIFSAVDRMGGSR